MLHQTKAIVVKQTLYSESSLIVQMFTDKFGLISFMVKGVRKNTKNKKAHFYQIGNILNLVMYYHPNKNFQLIKECSYDLLYVDMQQAMKKNCVMLFSIEVLYQTILKEAPLEDIFDFYYYFLRHLDSLDAPLLANVPTYFLIGLLKVNGYQINDNYSEKTPYLHLHEGRFFATISNYPPYIESETGKQIMQINQIAKMQDLSLLLISKQDRDMILDYLLQYFEIHFSNFKPLKSLPILRTILN